MTERLFPDPSQDPVPDGHDPEGSVEATPRRSRLGTVLRWIGRFAAVLAIVLAVAIVTTLSVDLGPALRGRAERAGSSYLNREMKIGRLSVRLLTGTFLLDDFVIGGLEPGDRPFLTARRLEISMPLSALLHREVLFESIVMRDWRMLVVPRRGLPQCFEGSRETPVIELLRAFTRVLTGAEVSSA